MLCKEPPKVAVSDSDPVTVILHVPLPVHAPAQPPKESLVPGVALSVT